MTFSSILHFTFSTERHPTFYIFFLASNQQQPAVIFFQPGEKWRKSTLGRSYDASDDLCGSDNDAPSEVANSNSWRIQPHQTITNTNSDGFCLLPKITESLYKLLKCSNYHNSIITGHGVINGMQYCWSLRNEKDPYGEDDEGGRRKGKARRGWSYKRWRFERLFLLEAPETPCYSYCFCRFFQ